MAQTSGLTNSADTSAGQGLACSAIYRLLALAYSHPTQEILHALREEVLPEARQAVHLLPPAIEEELAPVEQRLRDAALPDVQAEYQRVFTHTQAADCPLFETAYDARHVFQQSEILADIAGFYRAFGLDLAAGYRERADHLSVELEFLSFLAYKEAYALLHSGAAKTQLCRRAQQRFLQDHLGRWLPTFLTLLRRKAGSGLYASLASLTEAFLDAETKRLRAKPVAIAGAEPIVDLPVPAGLCETDDDTAGVVADLGMLGRPGLENTREGGV